MMEAIRKEVQKLCTGDGRVRIQEAEKNNCVVKHGLVIGEDRKSISPFVYLEPYLSICWKTEKLQSKKQQKRFMVFIGIIVEKIQV